MEKVLLKCDICGGDLVVGENGDYARCENCGTKYGIERLQKKYQEIRGSVNVEGEVQARQTGTASDISQWKSLLKRYMDNCDYQSALPIVRKILEASPEDEQAVTIYQSLRELQYFDIRNGVLVKYTGKSDDVIVPEGVKKVGERAFDGIPVKKVYLSNSVEEIQKNAFEDHYGEISPLCEITFGDSIRVINENAFYGCDCLEELCLPDCITEIQRDSLPPGVKRLRMPSGYEGSAACCYYCHNLEIVDATPKFLENLKNLELSKGGVGRPLFFGSPLYRRWEEEKKRKLEGKCPYCGGKFKGILTRVCTGCGREKDY